MLGRFLKRLITRDAGIVRDSPDPVHEREPAPTPDVPALASPPSFFFPLFWGTSDNVAVADTMGSLVQKLAGGFHFADNMLTWGRNMSLLQDAPFVAAWKSNIEGPSDEAIVWRRYVLACAAYHCARLEGDFVECGAYTGVGMKTVLDYLGGTAFPKQFWGYDVFEHDAAMLNHSMPEHGETLHARVREKFGAYPQVHIVKGLIPASFEQGCPDKIAYLHIDLNQAPAEIAALDHLFHPWCRAACSSSTTMSGQASTRPRRSPKTRGSKIASTR